jgi:hypothetical protein
LVLANIDWSSEFKQCNQPNAYNLRFFRKSI